RRPLGVRQRFRVAFVLAEPGTGKFDESGDRRRAPLYRISVRLGRSGPSHGAALTSRPGSSLSIRASPSCPQKRASTLARRRAVSETRTITISADKAVVSISGYVANAAGAKSIVEQTTTGTRILGSFVPTGSTDANGHNFAKTVVLGAGTYT